MNFYDIRSPSTFSGREIDLNEFNEIVQFLTPNKITNSKLNKKLIISFIGLIGAGKSTVARKIAEQLSIKIIRSDEIRWFLQDKGIDTKYVKGIFFAVADNILKYNQSIIFDGDAILNLDILEKFTKEHNYTSLLIHIKANEDIIIKRLLTPDSSRKFHGKEAVKFYHERKDIHASVDKIDFFSTIDTSKELDIRINKLINKIHSL